MKSLDDLDTETIRAMLRAKRQGNAYQQDAMPEEYAYPQKEAEEFSLKNERTPSGLDDLSTEEIKALLKEKRLAREQSPISGVLLKDAKNIVSGLTSGAYNNVRSIAGMFGANLDPIAPFGADPDSPMFRMSKLAGEWGTPGGAALGVLKFSPKALKVLTPFLKKSRSDATRAVALSALLQPNMLPGIATGAYESIQSLPGMADRLPNRTFGGDENSLRYQVGRIGGNILAPGMVAVKAAGGAQRIMPFISSPAAMGIGGAVSGAAFTPGNAEDRAIGSIFGGLTGYGFSKGSQWIQKNKDFLMPGLFKKKTQEVLDDILGGYKPTQAGENERIYNAINNTYRKNKENAETFYDYIINQAENRGFNGSNLKIKNSIFENRSLLAKDPETFSQFNQFVYSPSFKNAHDLQSLMGRRGRNLTQSKDPQDRLTGGEILKLRDKFLGDIEDSLSNSGNKKLAELYKKTTKFYKNNVVPYRSTPTLQKISKSRPEENVYDYPNDPISALIENNNEMQAVLRQLPPKARQALLARMLEKSKDADNKYQIQPMKKVVNEIESSGKIDLVNPKDLEKLKKFLEKSKKFQRIRNTADFVKNKIFNKIATKTVGL